MRIKDISVENYRNLNSATITFDESCNFIVGENNLGKSNILNLLNIIFTRRGFVYDDFNLTEYEDFKVSDLDKYIDEQKINWINIHGLNNVEWLKSIGDYFEIDNFMLADILNTTRRTKVEESHDFLFFNINFFLLGLFSHIIVYLCK